MKKKSLIIGFSTLCLLALNAGATLFTGSVSGSWRNVGSTDITDIYNITNGGTQSSFDWGIPATTQFDNRFTFTGFGFSSIMENTSFAIGDFIYRNGSTYNSTGIKSVELSLNLTLTGPVTQSSQSNVNFTITNTPNVTGNPVSDGDIVTAISTSSPKKIAYEGIDYTLNVLGFSSDGGTTIRSDFSSPEGASQTAQLIASITSDRPVNVPEPGTLSMFILGLTSMGGFVFLRRKK